MLQCIIVHYSILWLSGLGTTSLSSSTSCCGSTSSSPLPTRKGFRVPRFGSIESIGVEGLWGMGVHGFGGCGGLFGVKE